MGFLCASVHFLRFSLINISPNGKTQICISFFLFTFNLDVIFLYCGFLVINLVSLFAFTFTFSLSGCKCKWEHLWCSMWCGVQHFIKYGISPLTEAFLWIGNHICQSQAGCHFCGDKSQQCQYFISNYNGSAKMSICVPLSMVWFD